MFTTAQAEAVGVSRKQLVRMTASGVLERLAQGVYRMAGTPPQDHESVYATWLALGGATSQPTETGAPALAAAGVPAAVVHEDRKCTRLHSSHTCAYRLPSSA